MVAPAAHVAIHYFKRIIQQQIFCLGSAAINRDIDGYPSLFVCEPHLFLNRLCLFLFSIAIEPEDQQNDDSFANLLHIRIDPQHIHAVFQHLQHKNADKCLRNSSNAPAEGSTADYTAAVNR